MNVLVHGREPIVVGGVVALLDADARVSGVTTDDGYADSIDAARSITPDVVVVCADRLDAGLIDTLQRHHERPDAPPIVIVSRSPQRDLVLGTLRAGATGFVVLDSDAQALCDAIVIAAGGGSPVDPRAGRFLVESLAGGERNVGFTPRERDVLLLLAGGKLNKQIARELGISLATVKSHLTRVYERIGVRDRTQAAMWAAANGMVPDDERELAAV